MVLNDLQLWIKKLEIGTVLAREFYLSNSSYFPEKCDHFAFFGMGGSGVAGRILKTFFNRSGKIRFDAFQSCEVSPLITQKTVAFVASYSGNTWETVAVLQDLIVKQIPTIVITHGGRALELAQQFNLPYVLLPKTVSPRSALGYFLGFFLTLFDSLGHINGKGMLINYCKVAGLCLPIYSQPQFFEDFIAAVDDREFFHVWGVSGEGDAFAYRAQTQFNENSKIQAVYSEFPELCHNLIVGFTRLYQLPFVLFLHTNYLSENLKKALKATEELLSEYRVGLYKMPILGDTFDEQLFNIILWSDFASYHLGVARGVDVNPVKLIDGLKQKHKEPGIDL